MKKFFHDILSLRANADFEKTKSTISEGISLRGYNLWILLCSAMLASIGLDTNSVAVIIGAMLISPLMSPILGVGLSIAILDKKLLSRSLRNLLLAIVISLGASIFYFFLSPLGEPNAELQARTYPTLLDILIALFGGIAGIISISRHDQTNAIPGVAIATALMPPLCTAGFGIATGHWNFFLGAFYLFFINAVFISLATYLIIRYLHFPKRSFASNTEAIKYERWFTFITIVVVAPSIYFLYTVYQKELIKKDIVKFVLSPIRQQGNEILKWEIENKDTVEFIKVYHSGTALSDSTKKSVDSVLKSHGMATYKLMAIRMNLTKDEISKLSAEMTQQMFQEMHLEELKEQVLIKKERVDTLSFTQVYREVKTVFPYIDTLTNGWSIIPVKNNALDTIPFVNYTSRKLLKKDQLNQLYHFLLTRLKTDSVILLRK
jgi:uncharacterized hydrophobic protein (TIGR00271 family)